MLKRIGLTQFLWAARIVTAIYILTTIWSLHWTLTAPNTTQVVIRSTNAIALFAISAAMYISTRGWTRGALTERDELTVGLLLGIAALFVVAFVCFVALLVLAYALVLLVIRLNLSENYTGGALYLAMISWITFLAYGTGYLAHFVAQLNFMPSVLFTTVRDRLFRIETFRAFAYALLAGLYGFYNFLKFSEVEMSGYVGALLPLSLEALLTFVALDSFLQIVRKDQPA